MGKQNSFFVIYCLCLTSFLLCVYNVFVKHFDGHQVYETKLSHLHHEIENERLTNALLTYQIQDFQQAVAQVLPDKKTLTAKFELNNLASVVRSPASESKLDLSPIIFERGKKLFNSKSYEKAISEFQGVIENYPLSKHNVEARFFIAESYFLKRDFKNCLREIETMISQYPENDLTGFILLRMGQISEFNNQTEEASEVYKTVLENFKNEDLIQQAKKLANHLE